MAEGGTVTGRQRVVLASGNAGKVREINQILADLALEVVPQTDLGVAEPPETGLSFVENALIKARNAAHHTGLPALADDSGLEVDALAGAPGIYSARYAGAGADDAANVARLLATLAAQPTAARQARFQCLMVFMRHAQDPTPLICQGTWEGSIATTAAGDNGFGYDPVFWVPEHACTAAQLAAPVKNRLSHRGQALQCLLQQLRARRPYAPA